MKNEGGNGKSVGDVLLIDGVAHVFVGTGGGGGGPNSGYEMRGRQTGRTSRMLADAIEQARKGRAVYVVAANERHVHNLEHMAGSVAKELGIKFETPETLSNFDWRTMSLKNAHPNCVAIVDHYAIECEYSALLEMLHRYDLK